MSLIESIRLFECQPIQEQLEYNSRSELSLVTNVLVLTRRNSDEGPQCEWSPHPLYILSEKIIQIDSISIAWNCHSQLFNES